MLAFFVLITACSSPATTKTPSAANAKPAPAATPAPSSSMTPPREERLVITYAGEDGKTALELLKAHAQVRTAASQLGQLVEEINGVRSGDGHYLIYFINGAMAKTGADQYVTRRGDKVEWKLIGPRKQ
jgi:hypothetical protein